MFFEQLGQSFDTILLTETWSMNDTDIFRIPNYSTFYLNRSYSRGGGICILVKEVFECELLPELSAITNDYEVLAIKMHNTVIMVRYRPPSGSVTNFFDKLEEIFEFVNKNRLDLIYDGDININMMKNDSRPNFTIRYFTEKEWFSEYN